MGLRAMVTAGRRCKGDGYKAGRTTCAKVGSSMLCEKVEVRLMVFQPQVKV